MYNKFFSMHTVSKGVHPACLMHFSIGIRNSGSEYTYFECWLGVSLG